MNQPALIALDWGTTHARAALLDASGELLAAHQAPVGIMAVREGAFDEALEALAGELLRRAGRPLPIIASGMIGSRQGWREAPYLPCPARLADAAARLTRFVTGQGHPLHIVPGLIDTHGTSGQADVMRGEETQLWGSDLAAGSCCVLPGTHSKWAWLGEGECIERFATYMTGELYAVLTQHSILGRLMQFGHDDAASFAEGVRLGLAQHADATHALFAARTAGLTGRVAAGALPDFLSGLLIGIEIGSATRAARPEGVALLGEPALCARYEAALGIAGIPPRRASPDATTRGHWRVAQAAGLLR